MAFPYLSDIVGEVFGIRLWLPIPTFGLFVALAILAATLVAGREVRRGESLGRLPSGSRETVVDLALVSVIAGFVGARLFHIADHAASFLADPAAMIFSRSGFSIYGGLVFGVLAGVLFLKRRSIPVRPMLDAVAPALMLAYGIGRLGCQFAGDGDWGIAADMAMKPTWLPGWLWAQTYEGNILGVTLPEPGVYPTPLYEFGAALLLFFVLLALRSPRHAPGYLFSVYMLLAGFERLLIEKIRVNVDHEILGYAMTQAEAVSLLVVLAGLGGVLYCVGRRSWWVRASISLGVLSALSACAP